jgi:hypothetical protein
MACCADDATAPRGSSPTFCRDRFVHEYELPATEGKRGDPRWPAFARHYGFDIDHPVQWEVEALELAEPQRLVLAAVAPYVDRAVLAEQIAREDDQRRAP